MVSKLVGVCCRWYESMGGHCDSYLSLEHEVGHYDKEPKIYYNSNNRVSRALLKNIAVPVTACRTGLQDKLGTTLQVLAHLLILLFWLHSPFLSIFRWYLCVGAWLWWLSWLWACVVLWWHLWILRTVCIQRLRRKRKQVLHTDGMCRTVRQTKDHCHWTWWGNLNHFLYVYNTVYRKFHALGD